MKTVFIRVLEADDKAAALLEAVKRPEHSRGRERLEIDPKGFANVPRSPFAYWAGADVLRCFLLHPPLEGEGRHAATGAQTRDNARFVRASWEVAADQALAPRDHDGLGGAWVPLAKGGAYSPYYSDIHLLVRWAHDGRELKAATSAWRASKGWGPYWTAAINSVDYYGQEGLTWPLRTQRGFSLRAMPSGCIFGHKGPAIFDSRERAGELGALLAVGNSSAFRAMVDMQMAFGAYEVGVLQRTPVPDLPEDSREVLACLARRAWSLRRSLDSRSETSHAFSLPALLQVPGADIAGRASAWSRHVGEIEGELAHIQFQIDERCFELYGIGLADRTSITESHGCVTSGTSAIGAEDEDEDAPAAEPEEGGTSVHAAAFAAELVSWAVGVAFGRFDVRLATGDREIPPEPEPFDPLSACSSGVLTGDDGLPAQAVPDGYPLGWPRDGIMVDDAGHSDDLVTRVRDVFEVTFGTGADAWWQDCVQLLGGDLRRWLARSFFETHLKGHSKSRRKAPLYWQLVTPAGSYSVWLDARRANPDTLFRVLNDVVTPKLRHEEFKLTSLTQEAGLSASASQRKEIESQRDLVEELRALRDEVARVAPLWRPELDDGILVTCAPLWRLAQQHRAWQRETKASWTKLTKGEYDWAHLAMHLWPERVVPKCTHDRSLAIAHGLEEELWAADADGTWASRPIDGAIVERLVQERSSAAVKAALADLLAAG